MFARSPMLAFRGAGGGGGGLRPQDVFATSLYTGTGANRTINNGLDLAGRGGLTWLKYRNSPSAFVHNLYDTVRGATKVLSSELTSAESVSSSGLTAFNANGFDVGSSSAVNESGGSFVGWSFRRAPKFFAIEPYTGDGTSGRVIPHALGIKPGMIIVKRRDAATSWPVWHASLEGQGFPGLILNTTDAAASGNKFITNADATGLSVTASPSVNSASGTYVAYLFAHDPDTTNGIVQCSSSSSDVNGVFTVPTGWANGVQWLIYKIANTTGDWNILDTARTPGWSGSDAILKANTSSAETSTAIITQAGGTLTVSEGTPSASFIWAAIRAPIT